MLIKKYPDGGSYVINDQNEVHLTYRINSYEDLFLLKSIKDANPKLKAISIPCMFQQQHDRRFNQNESFELKLVCDFINSCGFEYVKVFHPHSDVTPALLNNCEVIDNYRFILDCLWVIKQSDKTTYPDILEDEFDKTHDNLNYDSRIKDNLILMSSDAGGFKPLMKLCKQLNWQGETYSASKAREKDKLVQIIDKSDFQGKDILIIDDICVYGGTAVGLAKMLKERNVGKLYLAISHITVERPNPDLWNYFDKVFTTNSKGIEYFDYNHYTPKNLEIINMF